MAGSTHKRKREDDLDTKTQPFSHSQTVQQGILGQYYETVQTLRQYVLAKLPASSRLRRKKIASVAPKDRTINAQVEQQEANLGRLLDSTLVAVREGKAPTKERFQQWMQLSQKGDESYVTLSDGTGTGRAAYSQSDIVDFVIWLLFATEQSPSSWPKHLLCDGYRRSLAGNAQADAPNRRSTISGLYSAFANHRVEALKKAPWSDLLKLLGHSGEGIMIELLFGAAIFVPIDAGHGNYCQISGTPLSDLKALGESGHKKLRVPEKTSGKPPAESPRTPAAISFVRTRMLFAKPAINSRGGVTFGMRHIHVLNRCSLTSKCSSQMSDKAQAMSAWKTTKVMMYMFPRQFGLHNVFTSTVDSTKTAQKFQDYTVREEEISQKFGRQQGEPALPKVHIPKRLRGTTTMLVRRLQVAHGRCSYAELLRYYCPVEEKAQSGTLVELATPVAKVSAFCQAVLSKLVPGDFWGVGGAQEHNRAQFLKQVDRFIRLRRFESMTLHDVAHGFKMRELPWLAPPGLQDKRASQSDMDKRKEILYEFLYYLFDSMLIPLVRSNFYVTDTNTHRYRLVFFRHDVWKRIAEPAMKDLRAKLFEDIKLSDALRVLQARKLGYSQVRLLPKVDSMRPIMNLRKRAISMGGRQVLGPSINTILGPAYQVLKYETISNPGRLGSAMFSVGDLYKRLKQFKLSHSAGGGPFYFAKVDVQAAFDTIPQEAMIKLLDTIPSHGRYSLARHVEIFPNGYWSAGQMQAANFRMNRKWQAVARPVGEALPFSQKMRELAQDKTSTIFLDNAAEKTYDMSELLKLIKAHIQQNFIKVGKKFLRQKDGIPQGSVLSSVLCNYFYADLEKQHLGFLGSGDSLLLRLIDDFLLITVDKAKASRFVQILHRGLPEYGVVVSPKKSLVNFDLVCDGLPVPRSHPTGGFPYCGTTIDCQTLALAKDRQRIGPTLSDTLTVEFSRGAGRAFQRKLLNAFKIQSHLMYFDTSHNSLGSSLRNLHSAFVETAEKMCAYARCLPSAKQPGHGVIIDGIRRLIDVSHVLLTSKSRKRKYPGYKFAASKTQVRWLALHAFHRVLTKKQSRYGLVLSWLDEQQHEFALGKRDLGLEALL